MHKISNSFVVFALILLSTGCKDSNPASETATDTVTEGDPTEGDQPTCKKKPPLEFKTCLLDDPKSDKDQPKACSPGYVCINNPDPGATDDVCVWDGKTCEDDEPTTSSTTESVPTTTDAETSSTTESVPTTTDAEASSTTESADLCGNGIIDPGEECDVRTHGTVSCSDLGYNAGGFATCNVALCEFDTSLCNDFTCEDGEDISGKWVCDGADDCTKGEDELGCECGDGVKAPAEVCDQGGENSDDYQVNKTCNEQCDGYGDHCGDKKENGPEQCDFGDCTTFGDRCDQNTGHCIVNVQYTCESNEDCGGALDACDLNTGHCLANPAEKCNTDVPPKQDEEGRCSLSCNTANPPAPIQPDGK